MTEAAKEAFSKQPQQKLITPIF